MKIRGLDMTGWTAGKLTFVRRASAYWATKNRYQVNWIVRCVCGKEFEFDGMVIRRGLKTACGRRGQCEDKVYYSKYQVIKEPNEIPKRDKKRVRKSLYHVSQIP
jgi:hypothetical protein